MDCAIKYQGQRNYYSNSINKCVEVVDCDTRGDDGISIVSVSVTKTMLKNNDIVFFQYYDWENNLCLPLTSVLNENVQIEEEDIEIPAEVDPAQDTNFPDFEPSQKMKLVCPIEIYSTSECCCSLHASFYIYNNKFHSVPQLVSLARPFTKSNASLGVVV